MAPNLSGDANPPQQVGEIYCSQCGKELGYLEPVRARKSTFRLLVKYLGAVIALLGVILFVLDLIQGRQLSGVQIGLYALELILVAIGIWRSQ